MLRVQGSGFGVQSSGFGVELQTLQVTVVPEYPGVTRPIPILAEENNPTPIQKWSLQPFEWRGVDFWQQHDIRKREEERHDYPELGLAFGD